MPILRLRYDMRSADPDPLTRAELYQAALEQIRWADRLGFDSVMLHEHHGTADGYLPSPLVMAAAVASTTTSIRISVGALLVPLHDPLRLAEDLAVVDLISRGRLTVVPGVGYVPEEFAMFGKRKSTRGAALDHGIETLKKAWTGEYFAHEGRRVRVTPRPYQRPHPPLVFAGGSRPAAERAARAGEGFAPHLPEAWGEYRRALQELSKPDPGPMPPAGPRFLYVAEDPEAAWHDLAPYLLHEMNSYGEYAVQADEATGYELVPDVDTLRRSGHYRIVTPAECRDLIDELGPSGSLGLHPLAGGIPPELSWAGLRLFAEEVLPYIRERQLVPQDRVRMPIRWPH